MIGRERTKSPQQVRLMRRAGLVVARTLRLVREHARPGTTTKELDALAEEHIRRSGAVPSFLGYQGFPASLCLSVNDEVVHGIPGDRVLRDGDLLSIDCGAIVEGWHGDGAVSLVLGPADPGDLRLVEVTEQALWRGIAALVPGGRLGDVGAAVEDHVLASPGPHGPFGIVEEYVGHGIGTAMHQDPQVPNYRVRERGPRLRPGLVVAVEPMLTAGDPATRTLDDDWTVVTLDGRRAAHVEHTVAVTEDGPWVLTAEDGGRAALAALGAPCGAQD